MTTFDEVLLVSGKFGWYQWRTFIIVCVAALLGATITFIQVFIGGTGEFWCRGSIFDNEDCLGSNRTLDECAELRKLSQCMSYNFTFTETEEELREYEETMKCENGWEFDHSVYASTITEEWELVCDRSAVTNILQSVYMAGYAAGCTGFGIMSDRLGRYTTFVFCGVFTTLFAMLSAIAPNPIVYGISRFFVAACNYGLGLVAFVVVTEMVLPPQRVYVGVLIWIWYAMGYFVLSALGKLISNWRLYVAVCASPVVLLIPAFVYLDESPRWLFTKGRYSDADKIIRKIAKTNNKSLPVDYLVELQESKEDIERPTEQLAIILEVIRNPVLRLYLLNLLYNWFVQSFVYYGLSLGTSTLGVDVYIAFCISGAVEIPAYTASAFTMKYLGRKVSTGGLMIIAGFACFITILIPPGALRVVFAMIGKFAITASFANIYVLTAEIFPTPIRTQSIGACSVAARIGGLIAPLILVFEKVWGSLPLICFASSSVIAGLLVFFLPETKGKLMPNTIEETIDLRKPRARSNNNKSADI